MDGAYVASPRAEGLLQVTRSLGDSAHHLDGVLLATPEITRRDLDAGDLFLVVASDGLWHTHSSAAAVAAQAPGTSTSCAFCFVMSKVNSASSRRGRRASAAAASGHCRWWAGW